MSVEPDSPDVSRVTPPVPYDEPVAMTVRRAVALLAGVECATPDTVAPTTVVATVPHPRRSPEDGPVDVPAIYRELASLAGNSPPVGPRGLTA